MVQSGSNSSTNHPSTNIKGGTGAFPTPANNVGGGKGVGDKGFWKGGMFGYGARKGSVGSSSGNETKKSDTEHLERKDSTASTSSTDESGVFKERPEGSDTLSGWGLSRDMVNNLYSTYE